MTSYQNVADVDLLGALDVLVLVALLVRRALLGVALFGVCLALRHGFRGSLIRE